MPSDRDAARLYVVHGRVQGVGFRYYVERAARELGLAGYVKNRADGTVEVYAIGSLSTLTALAEGLRSGPPLARVERVEEREAASRPLSAFRVEY